ncbi:Multidrug resistance protein MdtA [Prochlorococcus marinus str. MIT 1327]|nr:Multidrug resistance protein MdtA [Prochlorococcus marinus str. MIT 1312]KZR79558.1 Multidrug resistance protein MdtA [Prochlorococcus marinus str. MIT 1327]
MGGSIHRGDLVRGSTSPLSSKTWRWLITGGICLVVAIGVWSLTRRPETPQESAVLVPAARPIEAVAALGQLEPAGDVRRLAAPASGFGGTPRVAKLSVREGDAVKRGQVLAEFDNRPKTFADLAAVQARLETLEVQLRMQRREVTRYQKAALVGASSLVDLEEKQEELVKIDGQRREALAEISGLEADLADSQLKSPLDGVVLRVHTRVGERPGSDGVMEVGANQTMEALIEVYESDVNRVNVGQVVRLTSENGGFDGTLMGRVERISPQVRQRNVLSTDPTGDADARVVEVRVSLDQNSAARVRSLAGMKVIARFQPS